jgi:hypothetical protein
MRKTTADEPQPASAVKMAHHLCFERAYLAQLVSQGVLKQRPDGRFDLDANRRAYIEFLRTERKRSPKSEADSAFTQAKAELIQIRIMERKKELMLTSECYEMIGEIHGLFMTHLSALPAKIGGRDLSMRRTVEKAIYDMRVELSEAAAKRANERGEPDEPPLSEQGPELRPT